MLRGLEEKKKCRIRLGFEKGFMSPINNKVGFDSSGEGYRRDLFLLSYRKLPPKLTMKFNGLHKAEAARSDVRLDLAWLFAGDLLAKTVVGSNSSTATTQALRILFD